MNDNARMNNFYLHFIFGKSKKCLIFFFKYKKLKSNHRYVPLLPVFQQMWNPVNCPLIEEHLEQLKDS